MNDAGVPLNPIPLVSVSAQVIPLPPALVPGLIALASTFAGHRRAVATAPLAIAVGGASISACRHGAAEPGGIPTR